MEPSQDLVNTDLTSQSLWRMERERALSSGEQTREKRLDSLDKNQE